MLRTCRIREILDPARQTVTIIVFKLAPSGSAAESQRAAQTTSAERILQTCQRTSIFQRKFVVSNAVDVVLLESEIICHEHGSQPKSTLNLYRVLEVRQSRSFSFCFTASNCLRADVSACVLRDSMPAFDSCQSPCLCFIDPQKLLSKENKSRTRQVWLRKEREGG